MDPQPVRDAYSSMSEQYIGLFDGWLAGPRGRHGIGAAALDRIRRTRARPWFFDSDDEVAAFDHKVTTAYRWPVDVFAEHLVKASFAELQRFSHQIQERPDRSTPPSQHGIRITGCTFSPHRLMLHRGTTVTELDSRHQLWPVACATVMDRLIEHGSP